MQYLVEYSLRANAEAAIARHKAPHLEYRMNLKALRIVIQIQSSARKMSGSVILIEADNEAEAERIARGDPYVAAGIYQSFTVSPCEVRFSDLTVQPV